MKKNRRKSRVREQSNGAGQQTLRLASVIRENLFEFVIREGMKALDTMLEQDRERLCGPLHSKGNEGDAVRWGSTDGRLVMGGRRVIVRKPRARKDGTEVPLPSWAQFADEDPLNERTMEQMVLGVSTRNYSRSVEDLPDELGAHGDSKSAASRRFVEITADRCRRS